MKKLVLLRGKTYTTGHGRFTRGAPIHVDDEVAEELLATGDFKEIGVKSQPAPSAPAPDPIDPILSLSVKNIPAELTKVEDIARLNSLLIQENAANPPRKGAIAAIEARIAEINAAGNKPEGSTGGESGSGDGTGNGSSSEGQKPEGDADPNAGAGSNNATGSDGNNSGGSDNGTGLNFAD